jgi:AmmeMemoRadiSam system protein B
MMLFSKKVGAKSCEVIKYATSGDITGERGTVVGYCSAKVVK